MNALTLSRANLTAGRKHVAPPRVPPMTADLRIQSPNAQAGTDRVTIGSTQSPLPLLPAPVSTNTPSAECPDVQAALTRGLEKVRAWASTDGIWRTPFLGGPMHDLLPSIALNVLGVKGDDYFAEDKAILQRVITHLTPEGGLALYPGDPKGPSRGMTRLLKVALRCSRENNPLASTDVDFRNALDAAENRADKFLGSDQKTSEYIVMTKLADIFDAITHPTGSGLSGFLWTGLGRTDILLHSRIGHLIAANLCAPAVGLLPAMAVLTEQAAETRLRGHVAGALHALLHHPQAALGRMEGDIERTRDANGGWAYSPFGTALNLMALRARGRGLADSSVREGVAYIRGLRHEYSGDGRTYQWMFNSEIWDSAAGAQVLLNSGLRADDPFLHRSIAAQLSQQLPDGRWSFATDAASYPDMDDTCYVVRVLAGGFATAATDQRPAIQRAVQRAVSSVLKLQQPDGGWNGWKPTLLRLGRRVPGQVECYAVDPSTADVTGRVLSALAFVRRAGLFTPEEQAAFDRARDRAVKYLQSVQATNGSWWARWSEGYLMTPAFVLPALRLVGQDTKQPWIQAARDFVLGAQNGDGGWGETELADTDRAQAGRGTSTPAQTACAMLALLSSSPTDDITGDAVLRRAAEYLRRSQHDGVWENGRAIFTNVVGGEYYQSPFTTQAICTLALMFYQNALAHGVQVTLDRAI